MEQPFSVPCCAAVRSQRFVFANNTFCNMAPKPPRKPETVAEAAYEADLARLERDRVELKERIDAALEAENWELLDQLNDDFDNLPQTVEELRDRQLKAKNERAAARNCVGGRAMSARGNPDQVPSKKRGV